MTPDDIRNYILDNFDGVVPRERQTGTQFCYNPNRNLAIGAAFVSIVDRDTSRDRASHLNRPGVFRLNFQVVPNTYLCLFGRPPRRGRRAGEADTAAAEGYDFSEIDVLMPHPLAAADYWLCTLNPSPATFERCKPLLAEGFSDAARKFHKRLRVLNKVA